MENEVKYCDNCKRNITANATIHIIQCPKFVKLCEFCQEPVKHDEMVEHIKSMHAIDVCDFCKNPFERWKLEKHKNDCPKKPLLCKFCNLDVAVDDFREHAKVCWSRTEKCSNCAQYVKLRDMELHEKTCKNPSMMGFADCGFCKEHFPFHVIETHKLTCGEKTARCPDCGDLIKKYKNNHTCKVKKDSDSMSIVRCISCNKKFPRTVLATHIKECPANTNIRNSSTSSVSTRSEKANGHDRSQEVSSRPFDGNHHSPNSFPIEPAKNQAVELSPPVQRDLSDPRLNRIFKEGNITTQCKLCLEYLIPQESRIHPEICPMRSVLCKFCENQVPYNILQPDLHKCRNFMPLDHHISGSAIDEPSRQEKYSAKYSSPSNLSKEYPKIPSQECPLCFKIFPVDRFNNHVRTCAEGKQYCYFCKQDFFGDMKEHFGKCSKNERGSNKGSKQKVNKEEKNEGIFTRGWNYITSKKGKRGNRSTYDFNPAEKQLETEDGIPCEFCNEIYPFAEIAVHELKCLHEMSQAEEQMKKAFLKKKHKEEVPQASGYTPFDPSQYMITDPYENKDREPRSGRFAEKSSKGVSTKLSYSEPNQGNFQTHKSDAYYENFYEKHLIKDHEKDISVGRSQKAPKKAIEEGKKKDIIFTYSSETKNKFPVEEKRLEQGARPKFPAGKYTSKNYSCHKGLNYISDSDEETDSHQNKVKDVNMEFSSTAYAGDLRLNAIGSEREQKKSSIESKNNSCTSNENVMVPKSSSQDVSSCVTNKKGSFNSDTSEDVYLSCDEGEEISEAKSFNEDAKVLKSEERYSVQLENSRSDKRSLSNQEDALQRHHFSMSYFENYSKRDKDANVLKSEENDNGVCNTEKLSLFSKEDTLQKHEISMNDLEKGDRNDNHYLKAIDGITSQNSTILSHKEKHSLLEKYVMDIDDFEREADKKNEETFASDSRFDMNPFEAMSNKQFSYETVSSLPPYTTADSDCTNHGAVDIKSDDNLDAYLQFLGLEDLEPDANYKLFDTTHGSKALEPDSRYGCLENGQLAASSANIHVPKLTSDPQEPVVQTEELKGVSKNMPSYTSPFLIGNENEEGEFGISTRRNFPVPLHEKEIREISDKSRIEVKRQSQEEKDNEFNSKIWGTWREPHQSDSDE